MSFIKFKDLPEVVEEANLFVEKKRTKKIVSTYKGGDSAFVSNIGPAIRWFNYLAYDLLRDNIKSNGAAFEIFKEKTQHSVQSAIDVLAFAAAKNPDNQEIGEYCSTKLNLIQELLEEDVELIKFANYTIINFVNIKAGRFYAITLNKYTYICEALFPVIHTTKSKFVLACNGDFLINNNTWNTDCKNFFYEKTSATKSIIDIIEQMRAPWRKVEGTPPDWCESFFLLK